jgi:hypothetical protein
LLNLAYLFDPRPDALPPRDLHLHLAGMGLLAAGLVLSLLSLASASKVGSERRLLIAQVPACALALGSMAARLVGTPYLSAVGLFYAGTLASVTAWAIYLLRRGRQSGWLRRQLGLLTFSWQADYQPSPLRVTGSLLGLHILGLLLLADHFSRSLLWMAGLLTLLLMPQLLYSLWSRRLTIYVEALSPLLFAYMAVMARRLAGAMLTQPPLVYDGFAYPNLLGSLLNVDAIFAACAVYALLCEGYVLTRRTNRLNRYLLYVGAGLMTAVVVWAGAEYFLHRTHGVTASDPYAYAQMAVDLATHGDPLHRFPLLTRISNLDVSWWPVVHFGYQVRVPPLRDDGSTATDWPAGWPVMLSIGYLLLGESGLYVSNPIVGLACLAAILGLVAEVMHDRPWGERLLGGGFAAFLLATSYEQLDRILVPMADASAQLFTILTLFFLLRAMRARPRLYAVLAGCCFGWAYFIRHTELVLGLSALTVLLAMERRGFSKWERWQFIGLFGLVSLVVATPDLLYHQYVFGHFWTPESSELHLFSLAAIPATARLMGERLLSGYEFGYLAPVLGYGAYRMWKKKRVQFLVLLAAALGILLVQLPYEALRVRDLLSLFPVLFVWVAYGTVDLFRRVQVRSEGAGYRRQLAGVLALLVLLLLPGWRTWNILPRPWGSYRASFGYVSAEERRAFELVAQYTTASSVVGSSLNSGPIDLYAKREAFRPAFWTEGELAEFIEHMFDEGTAVYILDDGEALRTTLDYARARYEVVPLARIPVPVFGDPDRVSGVLYQIKPAAEVSS